MATVMFQRASRAGLLAGRRARVAIYRSFADEAGKEAATEVAKEVPRTAAAAAEAAPASGGSSMSLVFGLLGIGGGVYLAKEQGMLDGVLGAAPQVATKPDYDAVRLAVASLLDVEDYDDGSYGPLLVRLAWHAAGTYDKATGLGGSNGATMRFNPESEWGANAGLHVARNLLEPVKKQFPWISYADLWTLAGVVAIEEMGGPTIAWRPGRSDAMGGEACPPKENLPDGAQGAAHLRDVFYRMGFDDQEIVALSGAHTLGRCHTDRSGFVNPWTFAPTTFSNLYFTELKNNKWKKKKWSGPVQYEDPTGELMMLPTDMCLIWDRKFRKHVDIYAKDQDKFFDDFSAAFSKLLELGVPFPTPEA